MALLPPLRLGLVVETVHAVGLLKREVANEIPYFRHLKLPLPGLPCLLFLPFGLLCPRCSLCLCLVPASVTVAGSPVEHRQGHVQNFEFFIKNFFCHYDDFGFARTDS